MTAPGTTTTESVSDRSSARESSPRRVTGDFARPVPHGRALNLRPPHSRIAQTERERLLHHRHCQAGILLPALLPARSPVSTGERRTDRWYRQHLLKVSPSPSLLV